MGTLHYYCKTDNEPLWRQIRKKYGSYAKKTALSRFSPDFSPESRALFSYVKEVKTKNIKDDGIFEDFIDRDKKIICIKSLTGTGKTKFSVQLIEDTLENVEKDE
jgi:hypothetical protein